MNRKRLRLAVLLVFVMCLVGLTANAASAATGYIYIAFPTWLGNCSKGGSVTSINATTGPNGELWTTPPGGDNGDDLIYAKVAFSTNNKVSYQNRCRKGFLGISSYYDAGNTVTIYPTRAGQTFWIGLWGQSHN